MTLSQILIFVVFALLVALLRRGPLRIQVVQRLKLIRWLLLVGSVLAVYWMQPSMPVRYLDFWLPTATLGLAVLVWAATRTGHEIQERKETREKGKELETRENNEERKTGGKMSLREPGSLPGSKQSIGWGLLHRLRQLAMTVHLNMGENELVAIFLVGIVLLVGLMRYLPDEACCIIPTRPPDLWKIIAAVGLIGLAAFGLAKVSPYRRSIPQLATLLLIGMFMVLKTEPLAQAAAAGLRALSGQSTRLASALDIRWLGFSYIAFRLIHTLRDRLAGRLPALSLSEFITYIIFFPAFTAGPIDRVQRFTQDLRKLEPLDISSGGQRILLGIFKKFALADSLALIALSTTHVEQVKSGLWLWVLLYAYALRIYFDFSGYTDIAVGLGKLMGFNLPENFERPYLKPNLTAFWNSWHITLAQWFRAYFFNPLTRAMRSGRRKYPLWLVVLIGQLSTMLLIGLWHGITWNFAVWGLWHGVGLFIHSRWTEATRARLAGLATQPRHQRWLQRWLTIAGTLLTFHYVVLGWVWFALPSMELSWKALAKLFGG
jgi:alginate O-acetyltransferase complex protein AlgI